MDLEDEVMRGEWAKQLLENPLWSEMWKTFFENLHQARLTSAKEDVAGRELSHLMEVGMTQVQALVEDWAITGKMAAQQVREKTLFEKIKDSVGFSNG